MYAAALGSVESMRLLLDAGADPNAANDFAATPLMWCAGAHFSMRDRRRPVITASGTNAIDLYSVVDALLSKSFGKGSNGGIPRCDRCGSRFRVEGGAARHKYDRALRFLVCTFESAHWYCWP